METTERIVEAYVRYVKKWATIPNIRCEGQYEIDLIAIDTVKGKRYHIESGVSVSRSYSKLVSKPFSDKDLKLRMKKAGQRRTLDYFIQRKFGNPNVIKTLSDYGFRPGKYKKVIVSWEWNAGVVSQAKEAGVELWNFQKILHELADAFSSKRAYFTDDTLRTLHLFALAKRNTQSKD